MLEMLDKATMVMYGVTYTVDLARCRAAMLPRLEELRAAGGEASGRQMIAEAAGVDVVTLQRFLRGLQTIPETLVAIVTKGFGLTLADVVRPADGEVEALLERRA